MNDKEINKNMKIMSELSLGPFCNWFLPSCGDLWSAKASKSLIYAYAARSSLCLANVSPDDKSLNLYNCVTLFDKTNITAVKFAKKSRIPWIFVASNDGDAMVMDCFSGEKIRCPKEEFIDMQLKIFATDWSDDSNVYYAIGHHIIHWDLNTGIVSQMKCQNSRNKIVISTLLCCFCDSKTLAIGYMNGDISIVSLNNGQFGTEQQLIGHNDDICSLAFSWTFGMYENGILASASRDGFVRVWDVYRCYCIADIKLDSHNVKSKNWFSLGIIPLKSNHLQSHDTSPFEIFIGAGNGQLISFEVPSKPPSAKIRIYKKQCFDAFKKHFHSSVIFNIAIDPKYMIAVSTSLDQKIIVWDLNSRRASHTFYTFMYGAHGMSFNPIDPHNIAITIGDAITIINLTDDLKINDYRPIPLRVKSKGRLCALSWHPTNERRIAYGRTNGQVMVIDIPQSQTAFTKYCTKDSYDSTKIYTISWGPSFRNDDEEWCVYSVHQSGKIYIHYPSKNEYESFDDYTIEWARKRSEFRWNRDYSIIAVGNDDGSIEIYEFFQKNLKLLLSINICTKCIFCLRWNPNGGEFLNWLAVSSFDEKIRILYLNQYIDTDSNETVAISTSNVTLNGHREKVTALSWSPYDGNKLASASYDKTVIIWDVLNSTVLIHYKGHFGCLYFVEWSLTNDDLMFSGGEDNVVSVWRPSKQQYTDFTCNGDLTNGGDNSECHLPNIKEGNVFVESTVYDVLQQCIDKVCNGDINIGKCEFTKLKKSQKNHKHNSETLSHPKVKSLTNSITETKPKKSKDKKVSLFPLSNLIDNSSTKVQKLEDIDNLSKRVSGHETPQESNERILVYGHSDEVIEMVNKEMSNHKKQGNASQRQILGLYTDVKSTVREAILCKQLNADLVALSLSVSRQLWKDACKAYALQLEQSGDVEMAVNYLLTVHQTTEAIELLRKNHLYREATIIAKIKYQSDELINGLMKEWADHRVLNGDFEGAAKCLTSIGNFVDAAKVLGRRNDEQSLRVASALNNMNKLN